MTSIILYTVIYLVGFALTYFMFDDFFEKSKDWSMGEIDPVIWMLTFMWPFVWVAGFVISVAFLLFIVFKLYKKQI